MYGQIGMNITVWRNHSYWIDGRQTHEKKDWHPSKEEKQQEHFYRYEHDRLVYHQKIFYTQCLRTLKSENRTWTTIIDTDEYLAFNYYDPKEGPTTWCENNSTCNEEYLATIRSGAHFRAKLNQSGTAAEFITKNLQQKVPSGTNPRLASVDDKFDNPDEPCIVLSRFLIGSKESIRNEIQQGVDEGFDARNFHTLRFRYRGLYPQVGKCIVDASRSPRFMIHGPHRLYKRQCTGGNAHVHNAAMSFRIHHYIGSWETWRLRGSKEQFNERNRFKLGEVVDRTTPQFSSPENLTWLAQFVKLVGKEKALDLTQRVRLREEWEAERNLLKLNQIIS